MTGFFLLLLYSLMLGMIHGITPDEHTWPITFSYAIGSFSTKKGIFVAFLFTLAFTVQRALASEIVYLALIRVKDFFSINGYIYLIVGLVMLIAGVYVMGTRKILHLDLFPSKWIGKKHTHDMKEDVKEIKPSMALVHGFIAGWGFGSFALILYTIITPRMPNAYVAFLPGFLFGIGTMLIQIIFGGFFGRWIRKMKIPESEGIKIASKIAGTTLTYGGAIFIAGGIFTLALPKIASLSINTGIDVGNLHHLGIGFVMVTVTVLVIGMGSLVHFSREVKKKYESKL